MANFKKGEQIELFARSKFVTMTGKILVNEPVNQIDLGPIVKKYFPKIEKGNKKVEDPYKKTGIIGAFNRTINIHTALEMTGVYERVDATRYKYIPSTSPGGGLVYEEKYFQSNHATDPAFGGMHSAFDIVRIHKFGRPQKYIKDMLEFCNSLPEVKHRLIIDEFGEDVKEWQKNLELNHMGKIIPSYDNLVSVIENNFDIKMNVFTAQCELKNVPWYKRTTEIENADYAHFCAYFEKVWGVKRQKPKIIDSLEIAATNKTYHPIKDYLEALPKWDGVKRIETLLIDHMGADNSDYVKIVTLKTFAAAVQRIYNPGVKFDSVLTLVGPQGIGKSTMWLKLVGPEWFNDNLSLYDMKDKTASEKLMGHWIVEIAEMAGMRKAELEAVKGFMSRTADKFRPAFKRVSESFPRQCIFIATSNEENGLLRDTTGGRRFWIVGVKDKISFDWIEANRDQIWAEALTYKDEPLVLPPEIEIEAKKIQTANLECDEREGLVQEFLDQPIPPDWYEKTISDRKYFNLGNPTNSWRHREFISTKEIFNECFKGNIFSMNRKDSYYIVSILKKLGYKQGGFKKLFGYGPSKIFVKGL